MYGDGMVPAHKWGVTIVSKSNAEVWEYDEHGVRTSPPSSFNTETRDMNEIPEETTYSHNVNDLWKKSNDEPTSPIYAIDIVCGGKILRRHYADGLDTVLEWIKSGAGVTFFDDDGDPKYFLDADEPLSCRIRLAPTSEIQNHYATMTKVFMGM